ncbi:hypothetical protein K1T71_003054 [Dendrolimus kikuchii]|uniref:Uncharacterized protein n=1 Tax=Dendrolimus kikuchii TaxID=765133 RepID=A0ACC1DB36_9NEOP|nr:hypothetical protein K1T71_003054 [Dendrolimus kikuchii]
MDNFANNSNVQQSFRSPPRRRRSTFFERRDSIVPQPAPENIKTEICINETESEKRLDHLSSYYNKLLAEKVGWKNEAIERRHKYHDLRQQYDISTKSSSISRMSYSTLTNEDIDFLKGKPNIYKLYESQQKLHKSMKETIAIIRRANELDDVILSYSEDKVNRITEYILENSTVEPVKD